ncbi:polysaccharide deacetylase family protein [Amycolatopsis sp. FDAARGOS 1241]|uniref:polysaccharide deacetylase family protein n=1 Tax=Amycolatopsis sp. FDAARGOS 1241 TaxID=2778070 RepID=UPI001950DA9B|nr:polysaccharide deacetylase family protein [Amycolatopsis sp. FDAARGOS 1241]QRP44809.1 polysaccharide deacetylase family protein [Amycolatopsis sp. FDAARGOS 1241]
MQRRRRKHRKPRGGFDFRRARTKLAVCAAALLCVLPALAAESSTASASLARPLAVSLTFDDGNADQLNALPILQKYNMKGTFYIISGSVGAPGYLTQADLQTIAGAGHEIGGHTVTHPDLATVPADEAKRQICNDRAALAGMGFSVTSFAYPYASLNTTVKNTARTCGYNSARGLGDIASAHGCAGCPAAETTPPRDAFELRALDEDDNTWTLEQMQSAVTAAENIGGLLTFTFHHVCDGTGCDELSIPTTRLDQFLSWLSTRTSVGTTVKTINQVIGGAVKPIVTAPASTNTTLANTSLESSTSGTGFPDCYMPGGYGANTPTWTRTTDAHTGTYAERLDVTGYTDGDAKLLPTFDLGACTPTVTAGSTYTVGVWYKSTAITQFALYYRNTQGFWQYWTSGPWLDAAPGWTQGTFTTPPAPAGAVGLSFGLALIANGSVTTDDYSFTAGSGAAAAAAIQASPTSPRRFAVPSRNSVKAGVFGKHAKPLVPSKPGQVIAPVEPGD